MERTIKKIRLLGKTAVAALLFLGFALGPAWAGSIVVYGIKVTYPYAFDAYYNSNDGTLTIAIYEEGGALSVKALRWASTYWPYVDVFLYANCAYVPSITFKGRWDVWFYITGQVGNTYKLSIKNGFVGGTDSYGNLGLGIGYPVNIPSSISIKNGSAIGSVLGEAFWACP